jgi:predicted  nucleic acid-binding Zn-ribbon protein
MTDTKARNLDDKKNQADVKSTFSEKNYDFENLANNYSRTKNDLTRSIIDVDNQIHNYERDIVELQMQIKDGQSNLGYVADEMQNWSWYRPLTAPFLTFSTRGKILRS